MSGLDNFKEMDSFILLSIVNLKLRDFYGSLDELCEDLDINKDELIKKLHIAGYEYISEVNQFR